MHGSAVVVDSRRGVYYGTARLTVELRCGGYRYSPAPPRTAPLETGTEDAVDGQVVAGKGVFEVCSGSSTRVPSPPSRAMSSSSFL